MNKIGSKLRIIRYKEDGSNKTLKEDVDYKITQFPDKSLKFTFLESVEKNFKYTIVTPLTCNDDLILLSLIKDVIDYNKSEATLCIDYMMYQQDDRRFSINESFGLKVISKFINSMNWSYVKIFSPHSDKVELIDNVIIYDSKNFVKESIDKIRKTEGVEDLMWVIPDAGAFKSQMKMIEALKHKDFISCNKYRNFSTGEIKLQVPFINLKGTVCFIFDDIVLGGKTAIEISKLLKERGCEKVYLIVSHGVFNNGIEEIAKHFELIFTTDSICKIKNDKLIINKIV